MSEHPTPAELEAFATSSLPPAPFRKIARHLLQGCAPCNALLAPFYQHLLPSSPAVPPQDRFGVYDEILDRVFSTVRSYQRYLRREEIRQRKVASLLQAGGGWQATLRDGPEVPLRGLGALKALLDRSWTIRHESPQEMVELARLAVDVARKLSPRWHAEQDAADWQARAWGEYANALRTRDDLDEAERAFGIAFDFLLQGTGDSHLKAKLYDLQASYLGTRRRFDLAFTALDIVHRTYLELGDSHLAGRALLVKAIYRHYSGQPEEAMILNQQGIELIDIERDLELLFFAIHNQLWFLVACGRFLDARTELFRNRLKIVQIDRRVNLLKLHWLEGQISAGLGEWEVAEKILAKVREGFETENMGFAAAIASLELALIWMRQDRYEEAKKMVLEVHDVFVSLRIQREAFGSLMVLKEAFERQLGTIGLLEDAVEFLRRWYINPNEKFVPPEE